MNFDSFDSLLKEDASADLWGDYLKIEAISYLEDFDLEDWGELSLSIESASKGWLEKCAELLSEGDPEQSIKLLLHLLKNPAEEVVETAIDSLASLASFGSSVELSHADVKLVRVVKERGGLAASSASRLLESATI